MTRRRWAAYGVLGAVLLLTASGDTEAGLFRQRVRARTVTTYRARGVVTQSPPGCAAGTCTVPAPVHAVPQASVSGDGAAFLGQLNAWRSRRGRPPLGWDAGLAAAASTNAGVHQPGSSGGAAQCWAPTAALTQALAMWIASPAHASILLNATTAVGASPCPSGATANAR